jgi:hypothetical protein
LGRVLFQETYHRRPLNGRALFHRFSPFAFLCGWKTSININKLRELGESRGDELKQYPIYKTEDEGKEARQVGQKTLRTCNY